MAGQPVQQDLIRYKYYLTHGVGQQDVEPMSKEQLRRFYSSLPFKLANNPELTGLRKKLEEEIAKDYHCSLKKAIVDYILMDSGEKKRLRIASIPQSFSRRYLNSINILYVHLY